MTEAVIVSAVRSPMARGKEDGSLHEVHPVDLSAVVIEEAVRRAGIAPEDGGEVDDVLWGCAYPEGPQGMNVSRIALLRAGLPVEVSGATVNRFCSSGLQTIAMAAQAVMTDMAEVVVGGGVEMMSRIPRGGFHQERHPDMPEVYVSMGYTAERVAERWEVSREDQDAWALRSHRRAVEAWEGGCFDDEVVPVPTGPPDEDPDCLFERDELMRPDTSMEALAGLPPAFEEDGTVTPGNASPFTDGSAAVVVMSPEKADALGVDPLARFVTFATAGVDPEIMGIGPVEAVPKVLRRTGMTMDDLDLIELNEAFSAQVLPCMRELGLPEDRTNVNGGAIALGHPLGATGAKLTTQVVHALRRRGGGTGLVTMCVGGGMGAAGILEVYG